MLRGALIRIFAVARMQLQTSLYFVSGGISGGNDQ